MVTKQKNLGELSEREKQLAPNYARSGIGSSSPQVRAARRGAQSRRRL